MKKYFKITFLSSIFCLFCLASTNIWAEIDMARSGNLVSVIWPDDDLTYCSKVYTHWVRPGGWDWNWEWKTCAKREWKYYPYLLWKYKTYLLTGGCIILGILLTMKIRHRKIDTK